jgi:DNA-binding GntR family transcriptional regulator
LSTIRTAQPQPNRGTVAAVVDAIRMLIRTHQLLPGEPLRQSEMAERLGVSRGPVREALESLRNDGLVRHTLNQGYFVAKISPVELDQIVLMLRVLERAVLEHLEWPDATQLAEIAAINDEMARAADENRLTVVVQLNREFHEAIFALAPLTVVHTEIRRLWDLSDSYRALYFMGPPRLSIAAEHEAILDALVRRDLERLLVASDEHRRVGHHTVMRMLGGEAVLN